MQEVASQMQLYSYTEGRLADAIDCKSLIPFPFNSNSKPIMNQLGLPVLPKPAHEPVDLIIDGLLGYNAHSQPSIHVTQLIGWFVSLFF